MNLLKIVVLALGCCGACLAATKSSESIIGIWRAVKAESSDPKYRNPTGELEMKFAEGGVVTLKMRGLEDGGPAARTMEGKFTLLPPDRVTITLDGSTQERYRYRFKDGQLRMEHMDFPITNTLNRLKEFSL
jgi:hypothetical protein